MLEFPNDIYRRVKPKNNQKNIKCCECIDWTATPTERSDGAQAAWCSNMYSYPETSWDFECRHGMTYDELDTLRKQQIEDNKIINKLLSKILKIIRRG